MNHIYLYFLLFFFISQITTQPIPRILFVNDQLKFTYSQNDSAQQYYQLSMPSSQDAQILLISTNTRARAYLQIYIDFGSNNNTIYPTSSNNKQACYDLSLNTCPVDLQKYKNFTIVYFTVVCRDKKDYDLSVFVTDIYNLDNSTHHKLDFQGFTAGVFSLTPSLFSNQQVDIILMYGNFQFSLHPFNIRAGQNLLPTTPITQIQGSCLGAFSRIITFLNSTDQTQYFIVITAYKGAQFDLNINVPKSELKNNTVYRGQVALFQAQFQVTAYYYNEAFPQNITQQIHIEASTFMGSGTVNVYYCQQQMPIYRYENTNGIPAHFFLSVQDRKSCKQIMIQKAQGLLLQELVIRFQQILPFLGYEINFYLSRKNLQKNRQLWIDDKQYGSFPYNLQNSIYDECLKYQVVWSQFQTPLQLFYECQSCTFKFQNCYFLNSTKSCDKKILPNTQNTYNWTIDKQQNLIQVCPNQILLNNTYFHDFTLGYKLNIINTQNLKLGYGYKQIVSMNNVLYYHIKANTNTSIRQNSTFQIVVQTINGQIQLYTSLTQKYPNIKQKYSQGKQVDFWWRQQASYLVQQAINGVYIGVSGRSQALYKIYSYIDTHQIIPNPQPQILNQTLKDNYNYFKLQKNQTALLYYHAHIIPYNISISPFPSCLQIYTQQGQITSQRICLDQMPTHTLYPYQKIILRISNSQNKSIQFNINVTIPQIIVKQFQYISIACVEPCYTNITVQVPSDYTQTSVKHSGSGLLQYFDQQSQNSSHSNHIFTIKCKQEGTGCTAVLNASIPYGGSMFIENTVSQSNFVGWQKSIVKIDKQNPINLLYPLNQYSSNNNLLIFSQSAPIDVYYTYFKINISQTNMINYIYSSPEQAPGQQRYENFQTFSVVRLGQMQQCLSIQVYCLATITLFPVLIVQPIPQNSIIAFSSNSYTYHLNLNYPYFMSSIFGYDRFQYRNPGHYFATIKSLSNCDPIIKGQDTQFGQVYNDNGNVTFQVPIQNDCVYMITLTQCPYRNIMQGIQYYFDMNQYGMQLRLYYIHRYQKPFYIYGSQQMTILANISETKCDIPDYFDYRKQVNDSKPIYIDQEQISAYIIVIKSDDDVQSMLARIRIQVQDSKLILLPNKVTYVPVPSIISYNTKQNIQLCMKIAYQQQQQIDQVDIQIVVQQSLKQFFNSIVNLKQQQVSCININNISKQYMQQYTITINGTIQQIQLQIQQFPQSTNLYPSITHKDRISNLQSKCFRSDNVQQLQQLTYTMIFQYPLSKDQFQLFSYNLFEQFQIVQLTQNSVQIKKTSIQNNLWCIMSAGNPQMNFYITLQGNQIKNIVLNQLKYTKSSKQNTYDIYQYVSIKPKSVLLTHPQRNDLRMIKVVNCLGSGTHLKGSSNYQQIQNGKISQIKGYWTNYDMIIGTIQSPPGYYYFGIQTQNTQLYSLQTFIATSLQVPSSQWKLSNTTLITSNSNQQNLVVQLSSLQATQNITQIYYTLLIANSDIKMSYQLQTLGKCQNLNQSDFKKILKFQNPNLSVFKIPYTDLPTNITLFAYVTVTLPNALTNISYYYQPTQFKVTKPDNQPSGPGIISWIIILAIIFLVLFVLRYLYIIWKRRKSRAQIQFEMSESARQQQPPQQRQNNRGYGQFVDQAQ